ncbi:MAG: hypothetical protein AAGD38_23660 [Acidobacteriota bacterium]
MLARFIPPFGSAVAFVTLLAILGLPGTAHATCTGLPALAANQLYVDPPFAGEQQFTVDVPEAGVLSISLINPVPGPQHTLKWRGTCNGSVVSVQRTTTDLIFASTDSARVKMAFVGEFPLDSFRIQTRFVAVPKLAGTARPRVLNPLATFTTSSPPSNDISLELLGATDLLADDHEDESDDLEIEILLVRAQSSLPSTVFRVDRSGVLALRDTNATSGQAWHLAAVRPGIYELTYHDPQLQPVDIETIDICGADPFDRDGAAHCADNLITTKIAMDTLHAGIPADVNFLSFVLTGTSHVVISSDPLLDTIGVLYSRSGDELTFDGSSNGNGFTIDEVLPRGIYTLRIEPETPVSGDYTVTLDLP